MEESGKRCYTVDEIIAAEALLCLGNITINENEDKNVRSCTCNTIGDLEKEPIPIKTDVTVKEEFNGGKHTFLLEYIYNDAEESWKANEQNQVKDDFVFKVMRTATRNGRKEPRRCPPRKAKNNITYKKK